MVPAVRVDRRRRRLGVVPVSREPVRAPGQDLAVVRDPDLDAGDRLADRPPVPLRPGEADDGAHLGGAVALEDVDAHVHPALGDVHLERGCADADRVEAAPHRAARARRADPPGAWGGDARGGGTARRPAPAPPGRPSARSRRRGAAGPAGRSAGSTPGSHGTSAEGRPVGGSRGRRCWPR